MGVFVDGVDHLGWRENSIAVQVAKPGDVRLESGGRQALCIEDMHGPLIDTGDDLSQAVPGRSACLDHHDAICAREAGDLEGVGEGVCIGARIQPACRDQVLVQ